MSGPKGTPTALNQVARGRARSDRRSQEANLVDLLLMETMSTHGHARRRKACELGFRLRKNHAWPPELDVLPMHWPRPFVVLDEELGLPETDFETALVKVRAFVQRILGGSS